MNKHITHRQNERGATAMILVIFTTLLFVVITVGFMQSMTQEQRNSFDNELAQGAYDAALAGVEDGKRVLQACSAGDAAVCDLIESDTSCDLTVNAGIASKDTESGDRSEEGVFIKSQTGGDVGETYNQAYTCVKIYRETPEYLATVGDDGSVVFPLKTREGASINSVSISWRKEPLDRVEVPDIALGGQPLPAADAWGVNRPPLLRVQLIQYTSGSVNVANFDENGGGHTVYLYPARVGAGSLDFARDGRRTGINQPLSVVCASSGVLLANAYPCSVNLTLPDLTDNTSRIAYLRITSFYGDASIRASMMNAGGRVNFYDVQPSIDSTGRAADVYRRVDARVENTNPNDVNLFPRATVDTTRSFCKNAIITNNSDDYASDCLTPY